MIIIVNTAEALLYKPVKHANAHLHDHVITSLPSCPNRRKQANKRHVAAACCRSPDHHRSVVHAVLIMPLLYRWTQSRSCPSLPVSLPADQVRCVWTYPQQCGYVLYACSCRGGMHILDRILLPHGLTWTQGLLHLSCRSLEIPKLKSGSDIPTLFFHRSPNLSRTASSTTEEPLYMKDLNPP